MKREQSNIDNLFKDKLSAYESEPSSNSWENISKLLDREDEKIIKLKRRQKKYYIGIAASIIGIIVLSLIFTYIINPSNTEYSASLPNKESNRSTQKESNTVTSEKVIEADKNQIANSSINKESLKVEATKVTSSQLLSINSESEKREIDLPDGSKIYINKNTKLSYSKDFTKDRTVYLNGKAFFEVKHINNQPFVVYGNLSKTEVLGTSFMISSLPTEEMDKLFVKTGKVAFSSINNSTEKVFITAGLSSTIHKEYKTAKASPISDLNYEAWKTERIIFNNTSLREVISTVEKYFGESLTVANPEILNCRFTGTFEKSNIKQVLDVLALSFDLSFNKEEKKYTLTGKGCK